MSMKRVPEPAGNYYLLYTNIISPLNGNFDLLTGEVKPYVLFVNDIKTDVDTKNISLIKGANKILIVYKEACETYLVVREKDVPYNKKQPVSMRWYNDYAVLNFDYSVNKNSIGLFEFQSAPGLVSLTFNAYGKVTLWIDKVNIQPVAGEIRPDGLTEYVINLKDPKPFPSMVVIKVEYQPGYKGAGAIPYYFREVCGKGKINLGDWSNIDGLKSYSGGFWYRNSIKINADDLKYKLEIDLGDLVSSAELFINGKSAGIKVSPPWKFDITQFAKEGENKIEVLVYNTLANNYITIPTRYRGDIKSGLIGPVTVRVLSRIL
jgi:hypothetical protein